MKSTILACIFLFAASAFGQTWDVEQIDSTALDGTPVELAKASDGRLWACYKTTGGFVRVACLGDSGWQMTDVAPGIIDNVWRPVMAAGPHGELCLSCWTNDSAPYGWLYRLVGDTWQGEPYPFMSQSPFGMVAYDTTGRLHTAFVQDVSDFWAGEETDSGWTSSQATRLLINGWYYGNAACFTVASDGSPWYLTYVWWEMSQVVWGDEVRLMHFSGDTWAGTWGTRGQGVPIPLALVPHGDGVSRVCVSLARDVLLCNDDTVAFMNDNTVAGLAYTNDDVPVIASLPRYTEAAPVFASKTNRWHTEAIPGPAGTGGIDIETDTLGRPVIVYATPGSGLWCAVGTDVVGTSESAIVDLRLTNGGATVLGGAASLKRDASGEFYDATGRRVAEPKAGVYFVREQGRVRKVIVTR
jgi:hypothetical protein